MNSVSHFSEQQRQRKRSPSVRPTHGVGAGVLAIPSHSNFRAPMIVARAGLCTSVAPDVLAASVAVLPLHRLTMYVAAPCPRHAAFSWCYAGAVAACVLALYDEVLFR